MPAEHDDSRRFRFSLEIRFSEEFEGLRLTAFEAGALEVASGRLVDVKRTVRGENGSVDGQGASGLVRGRDRVAGGDGRLLGRSRDLHGRRPAAVELALGDGAGAVGDRRARDHGRGTGGRDADGRRRRTSRTRTGSAARRFAFPWVSIDGSADADIAGATDASYTLADSDVGSAVKVGVTFTDDGGHEETVASAATETVAPRLPPLTAEFHGVPDEHDWAEDGPAEDARISMPRRRWSTPRGNRGRNWKAAASCGPARRSARR